MKKRKHHNNNGLTQVKKGKTKKFIKDLAKKLRIKYITK